MLAEFYQPVKLLQSKLDRLLANGWFRSGSYLFKANVICLENGLSDIINIRLNLKEHQFSKSQRKLIKKVESNFKIVIKKATVTKAKNRLYENSKARFKGFVMDNLNHFLTFGYSTNIFNTFEICIYDNKKLIANSYFDLGKKSMASIIGLKDWDYAAYSLNKYTMLKEIEFGIKNGYHYYYPGFILSDDTAFDYKLKNGKHEFLDVQKNWVKSESRIKAESTASKIENNIAAFSQTLLLNKVNVQRYYYPLFSFANNTYENLTNTKFVNCPVFLANPEATNNDYFNIYFYDNFESLFKIAKVSYDTYQSVQKNRFTSKLLENNTVFKELLILNKVVRQAEYPSDLFNRNLNT